MKAVRRIACLVPMIVQGIACFPAQAFDLNGAWANGSDICPKLFTKTAKSFSFQKNSEDHGRGFIVDGSTVRGQRVKCVIKSRKENKEETHVIASCATDIMVDQVQLSFRTVDDNRIVRIFPGIGGFESTYVRCTF